MHVKSEKDNSILKCTYDECTCEEYEEQKNDADVWPDEQSIEDYEKDLEADPEFLKSEDKEVFEKTEEYAPFVDKFSDDDVKNLK